MIIKMARAKVMSMEFKKLHERHRQLSELHATAVMSFSTLKALQKLKAPNIVGEQEAAANLKAMNRYKGVFSGYEVMSGYLLSMSLARIFVANKDALHLGRLVEFAEQNRKHLTEDDFREFQEDQEYISDLTLAYQGLDRGDLLHIKSKLSEVEPIINSLKTMRDEQLAHINYKPFRDVVVSHSDIAKLIELSEEILNLFSQRHFQSATIYNVIDNETTGDVISLVHLARLETEHSSEIGGMIEEFGLDYNTDISGNS